MRGGVLDLTGSEVWSAIVQSPIEDGILASINTPYFTDGKEVAIRLPTPPTVVTKKNPETVRPAF